MRDDFGILTTLWKISHEYAYKLLFRTIPSGTFLLEALVDGFQFCAEQLPIERNKARAGVRVRSEKKRKDREKALHQQTIV